MLDKTSSIICAFGLASAAPRSPYRHLELCGIAQDISKMCSYTIMILCCRAPGYLPCGPYLGAVPIRRLREQ
ncbi:MAG: hypothetical protein PUD46_01190 [Subdoligranulum sp.]|nr:hypothetical protein [Subdoligranulum sp.]